MARKMLVRRNNSLASYLRCKGFGKSSSLFKKICAKKESFKETDVGTMKLLKQLFNLVACAGNLIDVLREKFYMSSSIFLVFIVTAICCFMSTFA